MPGQAGTIEVLARHLGLALQPLEQKLASGNIIQLFAELGLQFPPQLLTPSFVNALNAASTAAGTLPGLITQLSADIEADDQAAILQHGIQLVEQIATVIVALEQIGTALGNISGTLPGMNAAEVATFAHALPSRLLGYLLISYLETTQPGVVGIANLLGILDRLPNPGIPGDITHPPHITRQLQLSLIGDVLTAPTNLFRTLYGWGNPGFDGTILLQRLNASLNLLGAPSKLVDSGKSIDASLITVTPTPASNPTGLAAELKYSILSGIDLLLPISAMWSVHIKAQGAFNAGLLTTITPPLNVALKPPTGMLTGQLDMELVARGADPTHPIVLIGQTGGSRLQTDLISLGGGLSLSWNSASNEARAEPLIRFAVTGGKLVINTSESDGFVSKILSGVKVESTVDVAGDYSVSNGLHFRGSSALEILLASHVSLGPLSIDALTLSVGITEGAFPVAMTADLKATLGPLVAVVQGIGFQVDVILTSNNDGNLGPVDLQTRFRPPRGAALSLDAGGFKGGGFLLLDVEKGEYAGALELEFKGLFTVKAIALINTKLPDGSKGFSLLIIITAEFTPIQLGFGFTLNGVGGIFGLNRRIEVQALVEGIRTNAIKSILFPDDIVANITRIISDIKQFFPPQQDHFVVGPMAKLGWAAIVTVELGLLLDLPDPMFAIIGVLKAALPTEEAALLKLQINFIGVVDFDRGYIFFRADLFDSRLLVFTITGSMAFLISWGEAQTFALSVGGFHPDFRDIPTIPALPNGFRNMARIGISLLADDNPRLKIESYFAVTSNTVQFGSKVELYAGAGGFNVYGFLGFDVLFQFDPFRFVARLYGGIALRAGTSVIAGIRISAQLSGPTPWDAQGEACLSILFFEICVGFHVTWGDPPPAINPATADLLALLVAEYADTRNWRAELPPNNHLHVSLKKIEPPATGADMLIIHPAGVLTFSQRSLPLEDFLIQKFGTKKPSGDNKFKLTNANSDGTPIPADFVNIREQFAPANFSELSDSDKLSRRSFEKLSSGFKLSATSDLVVGSPVQRPVDYELSYLRRKTLVFKGLINLALLTYDRIVKGSAVRQSSLAYQQNRVSLNAPPPAVLTEETYAIANAVDLKSHVTNAQGAVFFSTQAEAYQRQKELIAENPNLGGQIQVISHFELNSN